MVFIAQAPLADPYQVKVSSSREQVNTFETVLESCYHAFQCHSRGVQALGQALRHFSPADTGSSILINASQPLGEESRQESSTEADPDTPEARAGEYLLSTQGAQLAAMITTRECEKLVSRTIHKTRQEQRIINGTSHNRTYEMPTARRLPRHHFADTHER